jgi:hypothetical protein
MLAATELYRDNHSQPSYRRLQTTVGDDSKVSGFGKGPGRVN